jgi:hypothetical protein
MTVGWRKNQIILQHRGVEFMCNIFMLKYVSFEHKKRHNIKEEMKENLSSERKILNKITSTEFIAGTFWVASRALDFGGDSKGGTLRFNHSTLYSTRWLYQRISIPTLQFP